LNPFAQKIKHLEGKVQRSYPNPNHFAKRKFCSWRGKREGLGEDLSAGRQTRSPEIDERTVAAALGHGGGGRGSGEIERGKEKPAEKPPGRGL